VVRIAQAPDMSFPSLEHPIVAAPMGGGPSTPELVAAVSGAGGFGFLAAAYKTAEAVGDEIAKVRALTLEPFGVNLFVPSPPTADTEAVRSYAERLVSEARRHDVELGEPRWSDDDWDSKIALLLEERLKVTSFTFGCPSADLVDDFKGHGVDVWITVTTPDEARSAAAAGADALVVQGAEAGAHRGSFVDDDSDPISLLPLLRLVAASVDVPLVAAGGIADGAAVAAALAAGAYAVQVGTAFLRCPEAGTSEAHRRALSTPGATALTRAFTGRRARGIVNRFLAQHTQNAPVAYPEVHNLTAPIRAAARKANDPSALNLWAGQAYELSREMPAADLVRLWSNEAREALGRAQNLWEFE
jgi:nitronate monooxygenase